MSRSRLWRIFQPLCSVCIQPQPRDTPRALQFDGFYVSYPSIKRNRHLPRAKRDTCILLWALDDDTNKPVYWKFYDQLENIGIWQDFIYSMREAGLRPGYAIHDGHPGITAAIDRYLPETRQQRCLVHIMGGAIKDLGVAPRTAIAKDLKHIIYRLLKVQTFDDMIDWESDWASFCDIHNNKLMQLRKGAAYDCGIRVPGALLETFTILGNAYKKGTLFTYLTCPQPISRTTNTIESNNGNLRELLQRHRGLTIVQRTYLISWYLGFKQLTKEQLSAQVSHTLFDT